MVYVYEGGGGKRGGEGSSHVRARTVNRFSAVVGARTRARI